MQSIANKWLKAFAHGFYDGFTGIVTAPVKGAVNDGGAGFAKGLVTGTLGVLFKPGAGERFLLPCAPSNHGQLFARYYVKSMKI